MTWLALDIGGANIKLADGRGFADSIAFPLWKRSAELAATLSTLLAEAPASDRFAVTMTGELADCFANKSQGVRFIVEQVTRAADGFPTQFYLCNGNLVSSHEARDRPLLAAASNWHALASFAGRFAQSQAAVLIDVGSTTCDIIPLLDGKPANVGQSDTERLLAQELVYTGVGRSPVCALLDDVPYRGQRCPVAQEWFATTHDVYVTLGDAPEDPDNMDTADGRPMTKQHAQIRLGRMLCADDEQFTEADAVALAAEVRRAQVSRITAALETVSANLPSNPRCIVMSGQGEFLARRVIGEVASNVEVISLADQLGPMISRCATAHALAVLAREASEA